MSDRITNYMEASRYIPYDIIVELVRDIQNDRGLHNGLVFNEWRRRNNMYHIKIKDISFLFEIDLDADPEESVIKLI